MLNLNYNYFKDVFIYFAALGLVDLCRLSLVAMCGLLIVVASLVMEHLL